MSTATSGIDIFLSRPREADEYREFIRRLEKDHQEQINVLGERMIAAQESEAVWKTERDKADLRRIEAEDEVQKLKEQLEFAHVANRREIIATECLAAYLSSGASVNPTVNLAILAADALIAALDDMEVGK